MVQVLEKAEKEILIKFLEAAKKEKVNESKIKVKKAKLQKVKSFAKKRENKLNINDVKSKLNSQAYGIVFRNY